MRTKVNRKEMLERPEVVWNGFIHVLAMSERGDLARVQIAPYLAFWYDSEVQNGGHLQYFLNRGVAEARDASGVLSELGAGAQRDVLSKAIDVYDGCDTSRWAAASPEEYSNLAMEGHFDGLDAAYYSCVPEMQELLQRYLDGHTAGFIEFHDRA